MYHKYNADKDFEVSQAEDTEAKSEFLRQRDFLERTVATLHAQVNFANTFKRIWLNFAVFRPPKTPVHSVTTRYDL